MENASKALIIAGAILIAIILISVGVMVMNSMSEPLDQASNETASQAAQIFNAKYTKYRGADKTKEDIKDLIILINTNADKKHKIGFYSSGDKHNGKVRDIKTLDEIDNFEEYKVFFYTFPTDNANIDNNGDYEFIAEGGYLYYPEDINTARKKTKGGETGYIYMVRIRGEV